MSHKYFKDVALQPPAGHQDDIKHLQDWLKGQPHLPAVSEDHLYLFLNSCEYQLTKTKETLENYYTLRTGSPELFAKRDARLPELQTLLDICELNHLEQTSAAGYHILLYRLADTDPAKFDFNTAIKMFCMFNDMMMSEIGLIPGCYVIFDMKGVQLGHLAKVNITSVKKFLVYVQDCQPAILKGVHVINTVPFIDKIMLLVKPFIKGSLLNMLKFHQSHEELPSDILQKSLPKDYGGDAEPVATTHAKQRALMEGDHYKKWYQLEETLKVDESKRTGKKHPYTEITQGAEGSFRKLAID